MQLARQEPQELPALQEPLDQQVVLELLAVQVLQEQPVLQV